jgi:hypothetical protein
MQRDAPGAHTSPKVELPPSNRTQIGLIQGRADVAWSHECNGRSKEAAAERSVRTRGKHIAGGKGWHTEQRNDQSQQSHGFPQSVEIAMMLPPWRAQASPGSA